MESVSESPGVRGFWVELQSDFLSDSASPIESFLHRTAEFAILVKIVQFLMEILQKQRILAVYHNFH